MVTRDKKITNFGPNWAFHDYSLNSPMALKWCTKLDVVQKRCLIVFPGHPSNFRSHSSLNWRFESNLSKITRPVTAIKSLKFALLISWIVRSPRGRRDICDQYYRSLQNLTIFKIHIYKPWTPGLYSNCTVAAWNVTKALIIFQHWFR